MSSDRPASRGSLGTLLLVAAWFGIVTGLVEGFGLLLFQKLNWQGWGPMIHLSEQIIWISPIMDLLLFCALVLLIAAAGRFIPRLPGVRVAAVLLTSLAVYDWLTLTYRLKSQSRVLLAIGLGVAFSRWLARHETAAVGFWKRTLPWATAAWLLALAGIQGGHWVKEHRELGKLPVPTLESPNVLVIVVDTLRADHLSSYGYPRLTSPNIDRLAQTGVLFENAVATCSWTFPSHVAMLTGRYQFQHGMGMVRPIPLFGHDATSLAGYPTIGEELERQGYRTAAFSANRHFFTGNLGFARGFTRFEDYFHSPGDMFARTLFGREFFRLYIKYTHQAQTTELLRYDRNFVVRKRADEVNRELLRWIGDTGRQPFFAFLNYLDVQFPYGGPNFHDKRAKNQPRSIDKYDDGIEYVDDQIGALMQELGSRGLLRNTLIILTSDHGESLGQHGLEGHGKALYWELIHVPLVIWYPGAPPGVRIARPVTNAAIPATIMAFLGARTERFPVSSLGLLWAQPAVETEWPDPVSELMEDQYVNTNPPNKGKAREPKLATAELGSLKSLVSSRWHLIVHKRFGPELYDWVEDPGELDNLIRTPAGQETVRRLTSHLQDALTGAGGVSGKVEPVTLPVAVSRPVTGKLRTGGAGLPVNDYYRVQASGGSVLAIEVQARPVEMAGLDPVVAITDADGELLQTCRNPGDDGLQAPGIADPTPDAYDDLCVNDDIEPNVNPDSRLEILVPGGKGSSTEVRARVSDWEGRTGAAMSYHIAVSRVAEAPATIKAEAH